MPSMFARRLDALNHIIPSDEKDDATCTMTCLFCGKSGHDLRDCSELNHWAVSCPMASSSRQLQSEYGASLVNHYGANKIQLTRGNERYTRMLETEESHPQVAWVDTICTAGEPQKDTYASPSLKWNGIVTSGKMISNLKHITSNSGKNELKENQTISLCNFVNKQISDVPKGMFDAIRRLRLSRMDILKWMNSQISLSHLNGFFLRLRLGKWEEGLGGTGYYVACITGAQREKPPQYSKYSISVNVGDIKCLVKSQYVSNHDFLEDELMAWWCTTLRSGGKIPSEDDLKLKVEERKSFGKVILAHILAATTIGFSFVAALQYYNHRLKSKPSKDQNVIPWLERTESGRVERLERFSHYVARQIGFNDASECSQLCKLAYEYLKRSKGCEDIIFEYFASDPNAKSLSVKLVEEFDRCILAYFAFHWSQASLMITQVLSVDCERKRLKDIVMAATRKQRFERMIRDLKVTRVFCTLVEEMKAIGCVASNGESRCTEVMVPVAHSERSPVLLLMGGGMGAGKSTVLKDILKESFWSGAEAKAVVVEADAFKETDVIYKALSSMGHHHDMVQTAELVHQPSTDAASSLLVAALNKGRDVIMDGTLSWEAFVEQTIAMARNVHKHRYRMGVGYKVAEDGTITENYWEQIEEKEEENGQKAKRKPYRIELVGVVCDPYLAIVRGIRRAIFTRRAVRVKSQLKSHKMFASAFPRYCKLVDNARLYCTNDVGYPPRLIAWKDGGNKLLVEPEEIECLSMVSSLNDDAESIYELYPQRNLIYQQVSVWKDIVLSPTRASPQLELKTAIEKIENPTPNTKPVSS
ncbi:hypothetical protein F0562_035419 [Nyssa sinensis]|uniref:CCHC-type domain-containing protein n=1 Tax=Nyssa sinensis TaxID=561372 RepID=A0A5J5ACX6_9ASTE|nr:hypothetical protein F0562_035419 [Nyssa sinensis]